MKKITPPINVVFEVLNYGAKNNVMHLNTINDKLIGNRLLIDKGNKEVINFALCSYLGLKFDERLRQGTKDGIDNYDTQFSSSRAYMSSVCYQELEAFLSNIFDTNVIVTPTSLLGAYC